MIKPEHQHAALGINGHRLPPARAVALAAGYGATGGEGRAAVGGARREQLPIGAGLGGPYHDDVGCAARARHQHDARRLFATDARFTGHRVHLHRCGEGAATVSAGGHKDVHGRHRRRREGHGHERALRGNGGIRAGATVYGERGDGALRGQRDVERDVREGERARRDQGTRARERRRQRARQRARRQTPQRARGTEVLHGHGGERERNHVTNRGPVARRRRVWYRPVGRRRSCASESRRRDRARTFRARQW